MLILENCKKASKSPEPEESVQYDITGICKTTIAINKEIITILWM